jgi:hypothetical protein
MGQEAIAMTSLAVSLSVDARGPSAIYILTDSRITWDDVGKRWDAGQKAFASRVSPDIFGFCGDAFFPSCMLHQILEQINTGLLFPPEAEPAQRHDLLRESFESGIAKRIDAPMRAFSIYHGAREGKSMASKFRLWKTDYSAATGKWYDNELDINSDKSYLAKIDGSGRNAVENSVLGWNATAAGGTSRAAVWAFCEALDSGKDPFSGGAPQLVGIWRAGPARIFGFVWKKRRYVAGLEVLNSHSVTNIGWFNDLFERCDGESGERLPGAQAHTKPELSEP